MIGREEADKNYEWFKEHLSELVKNYEGKYLAIKGRKIIGEYETFNDAWEETLQTNEAGTFIIQLCSEDEEKTGAIFYTNRVSFN